MRGERKHEIRQNFWRELNQRIRDRPNTPLVPTKQDSDNHNYRPMRGLSPFASYSFNVRFDNQMMVYLYILESSREEVFRYLEDHREEIRAEFGEPLEWQPQNQKYKILSRRNGDIVNNKHQWGEYQNWLIETAEQFHDVFHTYLEEFQNHQR